MAKYDAHWNHATRRFSLNEADGRQVATGRLEDIRTYRNVMVVEATEAGWNPDDFVEALDNNGVRILEIA